MLLSIGLSALFKHIGWLPHGGLALANSLASALEMGVLFVLMRRRLGGIDGDKIGKSVLFAAAGTAALVFGADPPADVGITGLVDRDRRRDVGSRGRTSLVMRVLRVPELTMVVAGLRRRIKA